MREPVYLGVDQGTRSSKAIVCNQQGDQLFLTRVPVSLNEKSDREVEQDPNELLASVRSVLDQAIDFCNGSKFDIRGIGFAVQRSGVCAWGRKHGQVLHPLITWADTRTQIQIDQLGKDVKFVADTTSLPVLPHYAAGKIARLQQEYPDTDVLVGTLDSFLLWHLLDTKAFQIDDSMAARTMLYDIYTHQWQSGLSRIFSVDQGRLPEIVATLSRRGNYRGIPVLSSLGDQQAALLALSDSEHQVAINFGSIISLLIPSGDTVVRQPGFITSVYYSYEGLGERRFHHLTEGITNAAASVIDHLQKEMKVIDAPTELDVLCFSSLKKGSKNAAFIPIGGSASPDWLDQLPIVIRGWDRQSKDDYVRAAVESIAAFVVRQIEVLRAAGMLCANAKAIASGGLSQCRYLLQFIANCAGISIETASSSEASAYGAAFAAQMSLEMKSGGVKSYQRKPQIQETFTPADDGSQERYRQWLELFEQAKGSV